METEHANSVFEQPWWLDVVAEGYWRECTVEENGKIVARLPYVMQGKWIRNPKFTQTLGIWMDVSLREVNRGNSQFFRQKEVISKLLEQLPRNRGISVTLDSSQSYILPFRWHGFRIEPTFSYRIEYGENWDFTKKAFAKHLQRDVNKALKEGISIETELKEFERFLLLLDMSFERQGRRNPMNRELVTRILSTAIENGHGKLMLAKDENGNVHSGAFFLYDDKVCYYLFGGLNPEYKNSCSQDLVLYKGIEFGASVSKAFDFEGSMIEGIENFFRKFGGKQVINYHISRQPFVQDLLDLLKPKIKKLIGYKI